MAHGLHALRITSPPEVSSGRFLFPGPQRTPHWSSSVVVWLPRRERVPPILSIGTRSPPAHSPLDAVGSQCLAHRRGKAFLARLARIRARGAQRHSALLARTMRETLPRLAGVGVGQGRGRAMGHTVAHWGSSAIEERARSIPIAAWSPPGKCRGEGVAERGPQAPLVRQRPRCGAIAWL